MGTSALKMTRVVVLLTFEDKYTFESFTKVRQNMTQIDNIYNNFGNFENLLC